MTTFIEEVALRLYEKYGEDISSLVLIMPSKRARLFFAESLSKIVVHPVWEPDYTSIDDLMCELSGLRKVDRLRLVAELHKIYSKYHEETFDEFYHWGEILLSDFDMVDKYMVDASQLFSNIYDLKLLESDLSYLSEEQIELINRFWRTLTGGADGLIEKSVAKSRFLKIWQSLEAIYTEFRNRLRLMGVGYTGMIYREAVEQLEQTGTNAIGDKRYIFIGFNALSKCEKSLLQYMQRNNSVEFYWDYDNYYFKNEFQEAGLFIRENLATFSESEGISHDNFRNINSINVISTSSNVSQCQCVVDILEDIASRNGGKLDKDTAVVLTDENLLMPLLYALPEKFKVERKEYDGRVVEQPAINVTMGYPIRNSLAYSFVERLLELQKHARQGENGEATFYHIDVDGLLSHPYIADIATSQYTALRQEIIKHRLFQVPQSTICTTPLLQLIFCKANNWREQSEYLLRVIDALSLSINEGNEGAFRSEFLAVISDALTKLQNIIEQCDIEVSDSIYRSLVRRHLQAERVSFMGEPLQGLQIMGILETRNLDFKNVILLSMTDNNFPGSRATDKSFLPYGLRYGFEIPTAEHHEGVYAYYFYRLAERAENLYMLYSSASDDKSTGEPSRYIRQLEYETDFSINFSNIGVEVSLSQDDNSITIEKSDEIFGKLLHITKDIGLSPTALSKYIQCPLLFYFNWIEKLRPEQELEESVDNMTFGNIFHRAADYLYAQIKNDTEPAKRLQELRKRGEVERCVDKAIAKEYFRIEGESLPELNGDLTIIRNIVCKYLGNNLLDYDIRNNEFVVTELESDIKTVIPIIVGSEQFEVLIAGRADRIDSLNNGMLRVIDYKTGSPHLSYSGIASLFHGEPINTKRVSNIINTLLYSMILSRERGRDIRPELYYISHLIEKNHSPLLKESQGPGKKAIPLEAYSACAEEFEKEVENTLREMLDRSVPFSQCTEGSMCEMCDYCSICGRDK